MQHYIDVHDRIGSPYAVSIDAGQQICDEAAKFVSSGAKVVVAFDSIELISSAFLNAMIGQLYGRLGRESLMQSFEVKGLAGEDEVLLHRVVQLADEYFRDPTGFERAAELQLA
jgi:hypothetical protein